MVLCEFAMTTVTGRADALLEFKPSLTACRDAPAGRYKKYQDVIVSL
jgi:hypothetical protein